MDRVLGDRSMADNLTREQRSFTMSRIRSKDSTPELSVRRLVHARGLRYRKHMKGLPGRPDLVFARAKVAVFVDGDFWHGWRFHCWRDKLDPYWRKKIEGNRSRDQKINNELRRTGWLVIRIWEHEVDGDVDWCVDRVEEAVRSRSRTNYQSGETKVNLI